MGLFRAEGWLSDICVQIVGSLREKLVCIVCIPAPLQNPSVFFSPHAMKSQYSQYCLVHHRGCAPGEAGLDILVACNMVAQDSTKDLLGTTSPVSMCQILCLVVPFSILYGFAVFSPL